MFLGIPRGFFYYEYIMFLRMLFCNTGVELLEGEENSEEILRRGIDFSVDEACIPVKLFIGQTKKLCEISDQVLVPRMMKDYGGRWLCPKLLGLPELLKGIPEQEKLLVTEPLYFNHEKSVTGAWKAVCKELGVERKVFSSNFQEAYSYQKNIAAGERYPHVEVVWKYTPPQPGHDEIILPNTGKVLITGHCYNVYDRFVNGEIIRRLDELGIEAVTDQCVRQTEREKAVEELNLVKKPFWESLIRILGTALCLRKKVEGIIYLSSFSCGPDAVIIEMLKTYVKDLPVLILKLDEHRGEAGFETRVEAFADLLERRRTS